MSQIAKTDAVVGGGARVARRKGLGGYTVTQNSVINNREVPYDALGMWHYMMSKPVTWQFRETDLRNRATSRGRMGHDLYLSLMRQLREAGLVVTYQGRDASGRVRASRYAVLEEPGMDHDPAELFRHLPWWRPELEAQFEKSGEPTTGRLSQPLDRPTVGQANPLVRPEGLATPRKNTKKDARGAGVFFVSDFDQNVEPEDPAGVAAVDRSPGVAHLGQKIVDYVGGPDGTPTAVAADGGDFVQRWSDGSVLPAIPKPAGPEVSYRWISETGMLAVLRRLCGRDQVVPDHARKIVRKLRTGRLLASELEQLSRYVAAMREDYALPIAALTERRDPENWLHNLREFYRDDRNSSLRWLASSGSVSVFGIPGFTPAFIRESVDEAWRMDGHGLRHAELVLKTLPLANFRGGVELAQAPAHTLIGVRNRYGPAAGDPPDLPAELLEAEGRWFREHRASVVRALAKSAKLRMAWVLAFPEQLYSRSYQGLHDDIVAEMLRRCGQCAAAGFIPEFEAPERLPGVPDLLVEPDAPGVSHGGVELSADPDR